MADAGVVCERKRRGEAERNGLSAVVLAASCSQSYRSGDDDEYGCVSDGDAVRHYGTCGSDPIPELVNFVENGVVLHSECDLSGVAAGFVSER